MSLRNLKPMTEPLTDKPHFLCTTALEDFWDKSKHLVFISEGCLRYSRQSTWSSLNGVILESPWLNKHKLSDDYNYLMDLYEQLLPAMAKALNLIHNEKWSEKYWRIVIGPWLFLYLHKVYERYTSLALAFEAYPDLDTIGLSESSFVTPNDTFNFLCLVYDDPYNLQLYTKILSCMGIRGITKELKIKSDVKMGIVRNRIKKSPYKSLFQDIYCFLQKSIERKDVIVLKQSYFSRVTEVNLFMKTLGNVSINKVKRMDLPDLELDPQMRAMTVQIFPVRNEFEDVLSKILPSDIPLCFIEGYREIRKEVRNKYSLKPKAIFSSNSWFVDEAFKCWAADCSAHGTMLLGSQHGGGYGAFKHIPNEEHERKITDFYYTWGWNDTDNDNQLKAFPASYLSNRKQIGADNKIEGILYVACIEPRFSRYFPYTTDYYSNYLEWQKQFISTIPSELRKSLRIRTYGNDLGWDIVQRLKDISPDACVEFIDELSFEESLRKCRLYVCDHLGTTHLEAFCANKPTILFWNPDMSANELRLEAKSYYDELRSVGILFDSPQAAAQAACAVYNDVERWWNDPAKQTVRIKICDRFARTSPHAFDEWLNEFKRIGSL